MEDNKLKSSVEVAFNKLKTYVEKEKFKGAKYKSNPSTLKTFSKTAFDEACHYIGLI